MKFIFLSILLLFSITCISCSCIGLGKIDKRQYKTYGLIVKGEIIETPKSEIGFYIKIETLFKGTIDSDTIKIFSPTEEGICGISPKVGETWLVYAYESGNAFSTNLCTRTKNMNPDSWRYNQKEISRDIRYLKRKIWI